MIEDEDSDVLDFLHSVQREDQIKIISWFLFQEGYVLPEIVSRLGEVYQDLDIVLVSKFIQALSPTLHESGTPDSHEYSIVDDEDLVMEEDEDPGVNHDALVQDMPVAKKEKRGFPSRRKVRCNYCWKVHASKYTLDIHIVGNHPEKTHVCQTCNKVYGLSELLNKHVRVKHKQMVRAKGNTDSDAATTRPGEQSSVCDQASHISTHANLTVHASSIVEEADIGMNLFDQEPSFNCDQCEDSFLTARDLRKHSTKAHRESKPSHFVCDNCGKSFSNSSSLKKHVLYDHENQKKPHECPECQKCFTSKTDLARHVERHSAEPAYQCELCTKKFSTKNDMNRHRKVVHEGQHAGSCDICGRRFLSVGGTEWTQHMNSHSGIKNISCPLCSKTFFTDNTLKCHMISHYDVMYWSCRICSKNFKRLKNVKSHLKSLHGILDKEEVGRSCIKLRNAPTKAEIQEMTDSMRAESILPDLKAAALTLDLPL